MSAFEVEQPILNGPFHEPAEHWQIEDGEEPKRVAGRRPAGYFYRDPKAPPPEPGAPARGSWQELETVNLIRERLAQWRELGYPGATRTTLELVTYWRREREHPLFFAQIEAAETIVFLHEGRSDLLQGVDVPPEEVPEEVEAFRRFACKMATGSGKTTVMGMLIAWSVLNKVAARGDARFSDVVLVVCPNLTIRARLDELKPESGDASIYVTRDLVPPHRMTDLRRGRVLVKNWHEFERKGMSAGSKVQKNGVAETSERLYLFSDRTTTGRGRNYITRDDYERRRLSRGFDVVEETEEHVKVLETRYVESDARLMQRLLGREVGGKQNILVLNDEAHHAYRLRQAATGTADEDAEATNEELEDESAYESTIWIDGLDRIHKHRRINFCVDLSATPYFLARAGDDTNRIFPWVVSDFGLTDAIESGLVKIPQLAVSDATGEEQAAYFNIWRYVMGRLSGAERGGKRANPKPEAVLRYAEQPIRLLAGAWEEERADWAAPGSDEDRPPVFILVCKNTKLAGVIYEWLAEGRPPEGVPPANIAGFRNESGSVYTIRVDSKVIGETDVEGARSDESRWMRLTLDTVGKRDWPKDPQGRPVYPEDFDELARKLDRPLHPPGRDVRCIVSVGMLTEGWDCNTVTHIVGLRPFMSQLLCEQVVGRGLRRASYDLTENGTFREEVAQILGVPFEVVPFKRRSGPRPKPLRQNHVRALPSRAQLEIRYPRVEGYQQRIRNRVTVDWDSIASVKVDPMKIPDEVKVKSTLLTKGRPSLLEPGGSATLDLAAWRAEATLQQREFELAAGLTRHYSAQDGCEAPPHVLFPQLLEIVKRFIRERVVVDDERKRMDVFLNPYWAFAIERLTEAIHPSVMDGEDVELPRYEQRRGVGSTAEVDFWTAKKVEEVERSHLNYVVQDSKWEASAAYHLDGSPQVVSFVKNQGLGFAIPYLHAGGDHEYIPDFLVRLTNGVTLILETKGHDPLEEIKEQAARRWVDAVNADGSHGEWRYALTHDMNEIPALLEDLAGVPAGAT